MKIKNKKSQIEHIGLIAIISFIVLASGTILADNSTINSTIIPASLNIIEKIAEIEVWADTNIRLSALGEIVKARLSLDNETVLPGQEIEFYLDSSLITSEIETRGFGILLLPAEEAIITRGHFA